MTLTPEGYRPRLIDDRIARMLNVFGAVSIEGPKWCGKTWTAENHAESEMRLTDSTGPYLNRDIVAKDIREALSGGPPHLIDDWQEVPQIWDAVRGEVDRSPAKGRFILTGSSVPRRRETVHSGAGRICRIGMRTMSLFETGDSDGSVSLQSLFDGGPTMAPTREWDLGGIVDLVIRGGWPGSVGMDRRDYGLVPRSYFDAAVEDASYMDGKDRNVRKMRMLLRSLARNESTLASNETVKRDMAENDGETIAIETYYDYTDCLDRIHLIDDIPSFRPNVRSDVRVGKVPKRHLTDVSLAAAALGLGHDMLMRDLRTLGLLFESLCEHDLVVYAETLGWRLFHYRDSRGREIDAVVETDDGRWGAFEIKLGPAQIDSAAENLLALKSFFEREGEPPAVLCVICGMSGYSYRRPDGVYVVPITALRP